MAVKPVALLATLVAIVAGGWWISTQQPALFDPNALSKALSSVANADPAQAQLALLAPAFAWAFALAICGCWLLALAHYLRERRLLRMLDP